MLTKRDKKVIISVAKHKILSKPQIIKLHFPSDETCQRRIRLELLANGYFDNPFYYNIIGTRKRLPLYRLAKKGKKLYKELTGNDYDIPQWGLNYIPHLLETNNITIHLWKSGLFKEFKIERMLTSKIIPDSLMITKTGEKMAIEVDLSEKQRKNEIESKYRSYEKLTKSRSDELDYLVFYTNRPKTLNNWIGGVYNGGIKPIFVARTEEGRNKLIRKIEKTALEGVTIR